MYLRITVNGVSSELSTKRKADPSLWNTVGGRLSGKTDAARELNAYLDAVQGKVFTAKRKLLEQYGDITTEAIKNLLTGREPYKKGICTWRFSATTTSRCGPW